MTGNNSDYWQLYQQQYQLMPTHDEAACKALLEYETSVTVLENTNRLREITPSFMREIADRHGTTVEAMKMHWSCITKKEDR